MAVRLRHRSQDIPLRFGEFTIGRSVTCDLSLDDASVSRTHAVVRVSVVGVTIEDRGSRNGVLLNGERISEPESLSDGDHLRIGTHDIAVHIDDTKAPDPDSPDERVTRTAIEELSETHDGRRAVRGTGPMQLGSGDGLAIMGGVADKILALGRADEAERILRRPLDGALARAATGHTSPETAERAAEYAVRLAVATTRGGWVDYVFRLYLELGILPPAHIVDALYAAVRKVDQIDRSLMRTFTARLGERSETLSPAERFVLQRVEGLERSAP